MRALSLLPALLLLPLSVAGCTCGSPADSGKNPPGPQGDDTGRPTDGGGRPDDTGTEVHDHADRVFIFVMDGIRASESVLPMDPAAPDPLDTGAEGSGTDPDKWTALMHTIVQRSVLVPVLENRDPTTTEAAHRCMVTGRRQPVGNYPWYDDRVLQRSFTPTIFEAAAAQLDPGGSIVHGNTVFMDSQGTSLYPAHPGHWVPFEATTVDLAYGEDPGVVADLLEQLDDDVRVVLLNLHQADKDAHDSKWEEYIDNASKAGRTVLGLAAEIGTDRDAFVLLADHGRHQDPEYFGHGDGCEGCRASWLMAFGAGVRTDLDQVTQVYEMADVAPTVAALLDIELPTARGRVIAELLQAPPEPRGRALVDPDLVVAGEVVHRLAQQLPGGEDDLAQGALLYQRSTDGGETWTEEWFATADADHTTPESPQLLADGDTVVRLWRAYSRASLIWQILAQHSADGGLSWSAPQVVADDVLHTAEPAAMLEVGTKLVRALHSTQGDGITNGPTGWYEFEGAVGEEPVLWTMGEVDDSYTVPAHGLHMPTAMDAEAVEGRYVAAMVGVEVADYDESNENREIFVARATDSGVDFVQVSESADVDYWPDLMPAGAGGLLAWASLSEDDAETMRWRLHLASSNDLITWTEAAPVETEWAAWRPTLLDTPDGPVLAWVETDGSTHRVRLARIQWTEEGSPYASESIVLVETADTVEGVSMATRADGSILATWHRSGMGDVHELDLVQISADLGEVQPR